MASKAAVQPVDDPDVDSFKHVPVEVKERFFALNAEREAAFDRVFGSSNRILELRDDLGRAERDLRAVEAFDNRGQLRRVIEPNTDPAGETAVYDHSQRSSAIRRVEAARARIDRAHKEHKELTDAASIIGNLVTAARGYLASTRRFGTLRTAEIRIGRDRKAEPIIEAIDAVRDQIHALKREQRTLAKGPGTVEEAKAAMREIVQKFAASGKPNVAPLFGRSPRISWPHWSTGLTVADTFVGKIDGAALSAWVQKDALIAALDKEIETYGSGLEGKPLTEAERAKRLKAIEGEVLELGYIEQGMLDLAASENTHILPRADADIRCILMLAPDSPAPRSSP